MQRLAQTQFVRWMMAALVIGGGLFFRLSYIANTEIDTPIRGDAAHYLIYAYNLLDHSTFSKERSAEPAPDAYWAPGYPAYLAAVIAFARACEFNDYRMILTSQALMGAVTILLTYLVGSALLPGFWALLPALLVTFSPHLISTASYVLSETLFGCMLLLSIYMVILAAKKRESLLRWLVAGCVFGMTYLVNPVALFLPILITFVLFVKRIAPANMLVLFLLPILLTVLGWHIRSAVNVADGQPTASGRLLTNLASGIYPDYHEKWRASALYPEKSVVVPGSTIKSYPAFFEALGTQFEKAPVQLLAWYGVGKPILLWSWNIRVGWGDIYVYRVFHSLYHTSAIASVTYSIMKSMHFWLFAAALLGMVFLYANRRAGNAAPWIVYTTLLYVSGVYVCTQAAPRYSIPLRPEMYLAAAYSLYHLAFWLKKLRKGSHES